MPCSLLIGMLLLLGFYGGLANNITVHDRHQLKWSMKQKTLIHGTPDQRRPSTVLWMEPCSHPVQAGTIRGRGKYVRATGPRTSRHWPYSWLRPHSLILLASCWAFFFSLHALRTHTQNNKTYGEILRYKYHRSSRSVNKEKDGNHFNGLYITKSRT